MKIYTHKTEERVLARLSKMGIPELENIQKLNELSGDFINLECTFPNGTKGKILDNQKMYLAAQTEIPGSDRCYGIAADEQQVVVYQYGCGGSHAVLVLWCML